MSGLSKKKGNLLVSCQRVICLFRLTQRIQTDHLRHRLRIHPQYHCFRLDLLALNKHKNQLFKLETLSKPKTILTF